MNRSLNTLIHYILKFDCVKYIQICGFSQGRGNTVTLESV